MYNPNGTNLIKDTKQVSKTNKQHRISVILTGGVFWAVVVAARDLDWRWVGWFG